MRRTPSLTHAEQMARSAAIIAAAPRKLIEWTPTKWWVVAVTGKDGSYTPLYQGTGADSQSRQRDCEQWLSASEPEGRDSAGGR